MFNVRTFLCVRKNLRLSLSLSLSLSLVVVVVVVEVVVAMAAFISLARSKLSAVEACVDVAAWVLFHRLLFRQHNPSYRPKLVQSAPLNHVLVPCLVHFLYLHFCCPNGNFFHGKFRPLFHKESQLQQIRATQS